MSRHKGNVCWKSFTSKFKFTSKFTTCCCFLEEQKIYFIYCKIEEFLLFFCFLFLMPILDIWIFTGKKLSFPTYYYYAIVHSIPLILNLLFLVTYGPFHFCLCIFFLFLFLMDYSSSCCFLVLIFSKETAQGFNNSAVIYPGF